MLDFPNNQNYKIIELLSQDSLVSTYKVLNEEDNCVYIIKKINLKGVEKEDINSIKKELEILSKLNSENVIKYFDSFEDNETLNIIMENFEGLNLRKYINDHKNSNNFIQKGIVYHIILEICKSLSEIHKKDLIHRDLKPENIYLTSDFKVKIGDGICKQLRNVIEDAKQSN